MQELDPIDVEIGRRVYDARRSAGLSQRELGERIGVTSQQVQKYEKGHSRMAVATLCRIAEELGVAAAALVDDVLGARTRHPDALGARERELVVAYRAIGSTHHREALITLAKSLSTDN